MTTVHVSPRPLTRRQFLKAGCLTVTAAGLTVCGAGLAIPGDDLPPVDFPDLTFGEKKMNNRVLIAYATYAGSTAEVAAALGETLGSHGLGVDVRPVQDNPAVEGYQAVVIGSAVQYGQWLAEAVAFVAANQAALAGLPVALFCVHIANLDNNEASRSNRLAYLEAVRPLVRPVDEAFFAGRFDRRGAARLLPGLLARLVPPIDLRNWRLIRGWAASLAPRVGG